MAQAHTSQATSPRVEKESEQKKCAELESLQELPSARLTPRSNKGWEPGRSFVLLNSQGLGVVPSCNFYSNGFESSSSKKCEK